MGMEMALFVDSGQQDGGFQVSVAQTNLGPEESLPLSQVEKDGDRVSMSPYGMCRHLSKV